MTTPSASTATVSGKAIRAVLAVASASAIDAATLAGRHGISLRALDDPDRRFPHDAWTTLWRSLERELGCPGIGIKTASRLPIGQWDVVDYLVASSETVLDALRALERYLPLVSTGAEQTVVVDDTSIRMTRRHCRGVARSRAGTELAIASIVARLRTSTAQSWSPKEVVFAHAPAMALSEYEAALGCPVRFHGDADAIVIDREVGDLPMQRRDGVLASILERHAQGALASIPAESVPLAEQVRRVVVEALPSGPPPIALAAKKLGTSARTLQRRLREADVGYHEIVDGARADLARAYLERPDMAIGEIAFCLGFKDTSAFYRAFRRWSGRTPGELRARGSTRA
ncbi:MAG: AraC family transcriptional regulator [Deltaproteobacteria bacterium]|nr:AraC family transcriptional regulator [Deltaproteobacteria bacterium]